MIEDDTARFSWARCGAPKLVRARFAQEHCAAQEPSLEQLRQPCVAGREEGVRVRAQDRLRATAPLRAARAAVYRQSSKGRSAPQAGAPVEQGHASHSA